MNPIQYIFSQPSWFLLLIFLGLVSLIKFSLFLISTIYVYLLRPGKNLLRYGKWAIVTGPTSGIGQSLAFELAKNGMNLILVDRYPDKLEQVTSDISALYGSIKIKPVVFDMSGDTESGIKKLREAINGMDVGLLINNAGIAEPSLTYFHEANIEAWIKIMKVNLVAVAKMTHVVLPGMLARKSGAIVNIGSGSAIALPSFPLNAIYTATKAFVAQFSLSLSTEYRTKGIDIQCQIPLYVATKMTSAFVKKKNQSLFNFTPDSDSYARIAVRRIGHDTISMPTFSHFLQWCFVSLVPDFLLNRHMLKANLKQRAIMAIRRERKSNSSKSGVDK
ncbi:hypothetical protein LUZ60_004517 [Juncus effusus]|nr:hypothetical protein LUZ60_004517 [Juncus effusus]